MLKYRLLSAIFFLTFVAMSIFCSGWLGASIFFIGACWLIWQALKEFNFMLLARNLKINLNFLQLFSFLYIFLIIYDKLWVNFNQNYFFLFYTMMIISSILLSLRSQKFYQEIINYMALFFAFFYVTWSLSFLAKIYLFNNIEQSGRYLVLFLILGVKSGDIGAYFSGKLCQKIFKKTHKILPKISPGKSWEGFFGGLIFSIIVCSLLIYLGKKNLPLPQYSAFILGFFFNTFGFFGDIIESSLKRSAKIKDSGSLIPGMGGVLDVVDSLILIAPLFYSILIYFIKNPYVI